MHATENLQFFVCLFVCLFFAYFLTMECSRIKRIPSLISMFCIRPQWHGGHVISGCYIRVDLEFGHLDCVFYFLKRGVCYTT